MDAITNGYAMAFPAGEAAGLSKRELFAAMAMQGLCANPELCTQTSGTVEQIADWSRAHADALLAELAKAGDQ